MTIVCDDYIRRTYLSSAVCLHITDLSVTGPFFPERRDSGVAHVTQYDRLCTPHWRVARRARSPLSYGRSITATWMCSSAFPRSCAGRKLSSASRLARCSSEAKWSATYTSAAPPAALTACPSIPAWYARSAPVLPRSRHYCRMPAASTRSTCCAGPGSCSSRKLTRNRFISTRAGARRRAGRPG